MLLPDSGSATTQEAQTSWPRRGAVEVGLRFPVVGEAGEAVVRLEGEVHPVRGDAGSEGLKAAAARYVFPVVFEDFARAPGGDEFEPGALRPQVEVVFAARCACSECFFGHEIDPRAVGGGAEHALHFARDRAAQFVGGDVIALQVVAFGDVGDRAVAAGDLEGARFADQLRGGSVDADADAAFAAATLVEEDPRAVRGDRMADILPSEADFVRAEPSAGQHANRAERPRRRAPVAKACLSPVRGGSRSILQRVLG